MVYLKGWPGLLRQQIKNSDKAILLDHGGIFKLATLYAFGPEKLKSSELKNWWNEMYQEWASTLNLVIWLDASEEVLLERINHRNQRHAVKGKPELEAHEFLECYRMAYRRIFQMLNSYHEQRLLSFDTNRTSIEEIADAVLLASGLGHRN
jgi:thymidylate kinase